MVRASCGGFNFEKAAESRGSFGSSLEHWAASNRNQIMSSRLDLICDWLEKAKLAQFRALGLAQACDVSDRRLRAYFSNRCGKPPQVWLNEIRLWMSIPPLVRGECIKGICSDLNFSRLPTYYDQFRSYFGASPLDLLINPEKINVFLDGFELVRCEHIELPSLLQILDALQGQGISILKKQMNRNSLAMIELKSRKSSGNRNKQPHNVKNIARPRGDSLLEL